MAPEDRIGTPHIPVDPDRVVAIVESDYPDQTTPNAPEDDTSRAIARNLIEFLNDEVDHGRLPKNLLPIQSGIGNIANAVIGGLSVSLPNNPQISPETPLVTFVFNSIGRRCQFPQPKSLDRSAARLLPRPLRQQPP
jgi:acyl-CoA hydrolase